MADRSKLPVLPLRNAVLFPGPTVPVAVGRASTLKAVEKAMKQDGLVFAVAQRESVEDPRPEQLHSMGVIAQITQVQRGIGAVQLLVTGTTRAIALEYRREDDHLVALVRPLESIGPVDPDDPAFAALHKEVRERALEFGAQRGLPEQLLRQALDQVTDPGQLCDLTATYLELPVDERQTLLETVAVEERLRRVLIHLQRQIEFNRAQQDIQSQVQEELGGKQREMYLREQLKAINRELGEEDPARELDELKEKVEALDLPKEARIEVERELARLSRSGRESMEGQVIRTYLQWVVELPWNQRSDDNLDLDYGARVLDEDHFGLEDVKNRVLEFLAVRELKARQAALADSASNPADGERESKARAVAKGPILLFVGPPGVGKTSIAQSIARALGRKYVRVALGGARDEADIRGHRRTYVGAMPGRILQGMKQAGTKNPVFLLDEVDKIGVSFQGDPAAALLEVLDPAQNYTFTDHYLNVPFDLSEVLFVATANVTHTIPPALLDRMEVVEFAGYTEREKCEIARRYLIPRQLAESGLAGQSARRAATANEAGRDTALDFAPDALTTLVARYTRESGVRQLEREIGAVARKLARRLASGEQLPDRVTAELVQQLLGRPRVHPEHAADRDEVGVATGLYYSPAGGDIMFVEAAIRRLLRGARRDDDKSATGLGDVSLILTGQLGDVMKESARAALTYAATHADGLLIPPERLGSIEAHIHVPAGAIPKDGPSAGVTIATALASALSGRPVRREVAMTGEITLRGHVLPIGGVKEKVLGAHRAGIRQVILPRRNEADLEDVPQEIRNELEFRFVDTLDDVFQVALLEAERTEREGEQPPLASRPGNGDVRVW